MPTKIEWTEETWNPVRGCSIVSKGCTNCYAMRLAHRYNHPGGAYHGLTKMTRGGPVWNDTIRLVPERLGDPLTWRKPKRIFVNSMSDLFHDDVPHDFIARLFATMLEARQHVFQILTKRPARMLATMKRFVEENEEYGTELPEDVPPRNVWLGVSVEDQASAYERIPLLLQTPAAVRWISAEPLLGPIDLRDEQNDIGEPRFSYLERVDGEGPRIDWVVAGGESGPSARPMHPDWARSIRDQCARHGVPFFFKQWGAWAPPQSVPPEKWRGAHTYVESEGLAAEYVMCVGKAIAGRELDGRTHDEYPTESA